MGRVSLRCGALLGIAVLTLTASSAAAQSTSEAAFDASAPCTPYANSYIGYSALTQSGAPYSATMKVTVDRTLADGSAVHAVTRTLVARTSGGKARSENAGGCVRDRTGQPIDHAAVRIVDPRAGTYLDWNPASSGKIARLLHRPQEIFNPQKAEGWVDYQHEIKMPGQPAKVIRARSIGDKFIGGVAVQGRRITFTIPVGERGNSQPIVSVHEWWFSTELGVVMADLTDDPERGRTEMVLENFSRTEPPATLFVPPAGYQIQEVRSRTTLR